ncbi:MAG: MFS transporter [Alphaproteobacteria bacterium]|nr:MAG: MFS transporter [Alphaproteobacteria bacterium]
MTLDSPIKHPSDFPWYLVGQGTFTLNMGIGMVFMPWLVAFHLKVPAEQMGIYQAAVMLPMLVLMLFGGAKADKVDLRAWLLRLHLIQAIPPFALFFMLYDDFMSYGLLMAYSICMSSINGFVQPARDSMLTHVSQGRAGGMQRVVGTAMALQTGAQVVGLMIAGYAATADENGFLYVFPLIMAFNYFGCLFAVRWISPAPPDQDRMVTLDGHAVNGGLLGRLIRQLSEIKEGIGEVRRSKRIRTVVLLNMFTGLLFMGAVMVLMPLIIRDVYAGNSAEIATMNLALFGGIGISSAIISRVHIQRQGRTLMLGTLVGGMVLVFLHFQPPLWAFYTGVFFWGLAGGVGSSMSRTIVQAAAPKSHLARILSVFAMATLVGGPIGSLAIGFLIEDIGILNTVLIPPIGLVIVWIGLFFFTNLWKIENDVPIAHAEYSDASPQ